MARIGHRKTGLEPLDEPERDPDLICFPWTQRKSLRPISLVVSPPLLVKGCKKIAKFEDERGTRHAGRRKRWNRMLGNRAEMNRLPTCLYL